MTGNHCTVSITHAIPCGVEATHELVLALELVMQDFCNMYPVQSIEYARIYSGREGLRGQIALCESPVDAKAKTGWMEDNHRLGGLFHYTVRDEIGQAVNRWEAYLGAQKCFVCGGGAKTCAARSAHSAQEYLRTVEALVLQRRYGA